MNWEKCFNSFQFHNHSLLHHKVETEPCIQTHIVIEEQVLLTT